MVKKNAKTTAVAKKEASVMDIAKLTSGDIPSLLEKVIEQISTIKKDLPKQPHTTGELAGFGAIEKISTVEQLIKAASSVEGRMGAYVKAAKRVPEGIKIPSFKTDGSTGNQWLAHIDSRMIIVGNKEKLDKLNKVKEKLERNLSEKDKLANDLKAIEEILNDEV